MATTAAGLDVIERTVHKTHQWIKEIDEELGRENRHLAFQAMRAVLQTLRDRLPVAEAVHLGDQLPTLIRGIYYESWKPSVNPTKDRKADDFLAHIPPYFPIDADLDPEEAARAVFRVLVKHVSGGEISDVLANLPEELRALWA